MIIALKGQFISLTKSALPSLVWVSLKITWFFSHLKFKFSFHNISLTLCRKIDYIFNFLEKNVLLCSANTALFVFLFLSHCLAGESSHQSMMAHTFQHSEKCSSLLIADENSQFFSQHFCNFSASSPSDKDKITVGQFPHGKFCMTNSGDVLVTLWQCFPGTDLVCTEQPPPSPHLTDLCLVLTLQFYNDKPDASKERTRRRYCSKWSRQDLFVIRIIIFLIEFFF